MGSWLPMASVGTVFVLLIAAIWVFYLVVGLDDLFIDWQAWRLGLRPQRISARNRRRMLALPERPIAIMIAAWHEDGVISRMITGNLARVEYQNYRYFIGVYPNDEATAREAQALAARYPQVEVVVNRRPGPTSKGQMINEIVHRIRLDEKRSGERFAALLLHDSEDLIHPFSLKLFNSLLRRYDFIQVPVFSLPVSARELVAGTYIDEFSECHTKDILVRNRMGVSIPSAGVGTAIRADLVDRFVAQQGGKLLNELSLTEDYELGVSSQLLNSRPRFACFYLDEGEGRRDYVSTRAYFPRKFFGAVRQKSRWTLGIAFQGWEHLGWRANLAQNYFLYRDRKGPWNSILVLVGMLCSGLLYAYWPWLLSRAAAEGFDVQLWGAAIWISSALMLNRLFQRMRCTRRIYGWRVAALAPVRLLVGNAINALASLRATGQYVNGKIRGRRPQWTKTDHELPENFGLECKPLP